MNTRLAEYVQAPPEDAGFIDQCEKAATAIVKACLLYTSDAADDLLTV